MDLFQLFWRCIYFILFRLQTAFQWPTNLARSIFARCQWRHCRMTTNFTTITSTKRRQKRSFTGRQTFRNFLPQWPKNLASQKLKIGGLTKFALRKLRSNIIWKVKQIFPYRTKTVFKIAAMLLEFHLWWYTKKQIDLKVSKKRHLD